MLASFLFTHLRNSMVNSLEKMLINICCFYLACNQVGSTGLFDVPQSELTFFKSLSRLYIDMYNTHAAMPAHHYSPVAL